MLFAKHNHLVLLLILFCIITSPIISLDSELRLTPGVDIPVGDAADILKLGGSARLDGVLQLWELPVHPVISGDYMYFGTEADTSISLLSGRAGFLGVLSLGSRLTIDLLLTAGAFYGMQNEGEVTDTDLVYGGDLSLRFLATERVDLTVGASYRSYSGLLNDVGFTIGTSFFLGDSSQRRRLIEDSRRSGQILPDTLTPGAGRGVELLDVSLNDVFPVFYSYYDEHPIGTATLKNLESRSVTDVKVALYIKQFMDTPKTCVEIPVMEKGVSERIELFSLLTDDIMSVTEGSKVAAEIQVTFQMEGQRYGFIDSETIRLLDRNAMTWEDDRRACAFVTAKDPVILNYSKNLSGLVNEKGSMAVNKNLQTAMAVHEGLRLMGINYSPDPTTPYVEFSETKTKIDYLQFPRQTIQYKAGDCDDLTILYAAILESVGIETAFITVPGHIFLAFNLDQDPVELSQTYLSSENMIFIHDKAWIPVEVTQRSGGFIQAWQEGSKLWREAVSGNKQGFYEVHQAWQLYEPVGLKEEVPEVVWPSKEAILAAYFEELMAFIDRELYPRVREIEAKLSSNPEDIRMRNKLGVLYSRYGVWDKAEKEYERVLTKNSDYYPALINMGNINYINQDWIQSLAYYERAQSVRPSNSDVLLGLARVHFELENFGMSRVFFEQLAKNDSELAGKYAYLELGSSEAARASNISLRRGGVIWNE